MTNHIMNGDLKICRFSVCLVILERILLFRLAISNHYSIYCVICILFLLCIFFEDSYIVTSVNNILNCNKMHYNNISLEPLCVNNVSIIITFFFLSIFIFIYFSSLGMYRRRQYVCWGRSMVLPATIITILIYCAYLYV